MALLPSIMSLFGGPKTPAGPVADPATQAAQTTAAAGNPSVPSVATPTSTGSMPAIPAAGTGDASPLANFSDLWKTDPNNNQQTPSLVPSFNLDHKGLMDAAKKVNFTGHIAPELVTKAMSGDAAAFLEVINSAAQLGFANATAASGELVKQSLTNANGVLQDTVLPNAFRSRDISTAINESNPIFSDPAVAPMLGMLKTQLQAKYPTATPKEIADTATQYLSSMSQRITGVAPPQAGQRGNGNGFQAQPEQDWSTFFE